MASSPSQLCIHGNFVLIGKEPDGDSVRFVPTNPALLQELNRAYRIKPSTVDGSVQLRFEGIDAPELHYGAALQPLGSVARDALLSKVGFTNIQYKGTTVTDCTPKTIPGAILAVMAEANGRPVSYILVGTQLPPDGEWVAVTDHILKQTMNYAMITNGMAYYTVYTSMPKHHRTVFHEAAQAARQQSAPLAAAAGAGVGVTASTSSATGNATVWNLDSSREFRLDDQNSIGPNGALILPKL
ncbi:MAG TPA: thermonuclease family protein, partial [Terriglobales bacterium]|nr:thermonuclease family protein [Terriglobales bacterium]